MEIPRIIPTDQPTEFNDDDYTHDPNRRPSETLPPSASSEKVDTFE